MTLSRPDHNLLNEPMLRELADGISFVAEREDIKLSGALRPRKSASAKISTACARLQSRLKRRPLGVAGIMPRWIAASFRSRDSRLLEQW